MTNPPTTSSQRFIVTNDLPQPDVILASGSPRRRELLQSLDIPFQIIKPDVDEAAVDIAGLTPAQVVEKLASIKAEAVAKLVSRESLSPHRLIIGSDTIVVQNNQILGKPVDKADAVRMLKQLQGTEHTVYSGIAVIRQQTQQQTAESNLLVSHLATRVWMQAMTDIEIDRYIATSEPMDKAGSYAIQGYGALLIDRIDGCYFNVVGMSLTLLHQLLKQHGVKLI